jgi:hypothetical protein
MVLEYLAEDTSANREVLADRLPNCQIVYNNADGTGAYKPSMERGR